MLPVKSAISQPSFWCSLRHSLFAHNIVCTYCVVVVIFLGFVFLLTYLRLYPFLFVFMEINVLFVACEYLRLLCLLLLVSGGCIVDYCQLGKTARGFLCDDAG